jgi:hypothetical protein
MGIYEEAKYYLVSSLVKIGEIAQNNIDWSVVRSTCEYIWSVRCRRF